CQNCDSVPLTF
nr:immunoglobulin light chain junction region [Macaca mulatta]